jgi:hypothetical protein
MRKNILIVILVAIITLMTAPKILDKSRHTPTPVWTVEDSKAYAQDALLKWNQKQWVCLTQLWGKESAWNPNAYNKIKVMGKNAGGIPQLLGLDPATPPTQQIDRGLAYIYNRYKTPCLAWKHFTKYGWH